MDHGSGAWHGRGNVFITMCGRPSPMLCVLLAVAAPACPRQRRAVYMRWPWRARCHPRLRVHCTGVNESARVVLSIAISWCTHWINACTHNSPGTNPGHGHGLPMSMLVSHGPPPLTTRLPAGRAPSEAPHGPQPGTPVKPRGGPREAPQWPCIPINGPWPK